MRMPFAFVDVDRLDAATHGAMWEIYRAGHEITRAEFEAASFRKFDRIFLYRRRDGVLRGFMGIRDRTLCLPDASRIRCIYFGQACFRPEDRGSGMAVVAPLLLSVGHVLRFPGRRALGWFDALTVRPYLMSHRAAAEVYPDPRRPTPPELIEVRDRLGHTYYGDAYDPARGVIRKTARLVSEPPVDPARLADPLVRHYVELNPGYVDGDGLLVLVPVTMATVRRALRRILKVRRRGPSAPSDGDDGRALPA